jgi:SAM-dependent methyltransferase
MRNAWAPVSILRNLEAELLNRLTEMGTRLLLVPRIRFHFVKWRWRRLKKNMRHHQNSTAGVGENVVSYNLTAFDSDAAFGCGGRMDLVLYPLAALAPKTASVLIVGPRTEDDIYLSKALGFENSRGLDLFTYSPHIDLGDMHALPYPSDSFDAIVLGWVVAYSSDPQKAIDECKRCLRPGGFLAVGWEWVPDSDKKTNLHIRGNPANGPEDFRTMAGYPVVFLNDPSTATNHHKSIIFRKPK